MANTDVVSSDEGLRKYVKQLFIENGGSPSEFDDALDDIVEEFDEQVMQVVRDEAETVMTHESADGYVSYIVGYNDLMFKAILVESDESDWFDSQSEAEGWIMSQGVW